MTDYLHLFLIGVTAVLGCAVAGAAVVGLLAVATVQPWSLLVAVPVFALLVGGLLAAMAWVVDR